MADYDLELILLIQMEGYSSPKWILMLFTADTTSSSLEGGEGRRERISQ